MMMKYLWLTFLVAVCLAGTDACSCLPTTLKGSFFAEDTETVVKGKVVFAAAPPNMDPFGKRLFVIKTETVYKGCKVSPWFIAESAVSSATCGVNLQRGTSYLFVLPAAGTAALRSINSCMFIRRFSSLSEEDAQFLRNRNVCCGGVCKCASGDRPVNCFRRPCSPPETAPCKEAVTCVDNYCGGCLAEWFTKDGQYACLPNLFPYV